MEALKQALLALTHNVYNFTVAPGTAPPYLVWGTATSRLLPW